MSDAHLYRIAASNPTAHLYTVSVTVRRPDPDGQRLALPAWVPGSYLVRDYARHVVSIRAESGGVDVPLTKIDKSTWQAGKVDRELTVTAEIYAQETGVRGAHLDQTHAFFDGACVFLRIVGQDDVPCELDVVEPDFKAAANWRVATSMQRLGAAQYGFGTYRAANYEELIDHPFEIGELTVGEFDACGIPHAIAIRGRVRTDMARLCHDLQTLCEQHLGFLGIPDDLDRYLFLLHAPGQGYGGLEHRWSTSLVCSRDNLPVKGESGVDESYRTFLGLASHEYFHLWNVKRIRPASVSSSDLAAEAYTRLLWVFEGITSYYDDLQLYRSGLIDVQSYFELLGRTMTRLRRGPGRTRQSVAESSFDTWIKFYKQNENSPNSIVSYYVKGALIALCLDLKLRVESDNGVSLDDVMHEFWTRYGNDQNGVPEDGFEAVCSDVAGFDLGNFFDANVRGTGELPLESLLKSHGVLLKLRPARGRDDKGGTPPKPDEKTPPSLGAVVMDRNGRVVFGPVINGGAAERAGISPGDEAVALDGLKLTSGNIDKRLKAHRDGDRVELVVFRDDELQTFRVRLDAAPEDTCYLLVDKDAAPDAESRREAWLARSE